MIIAQLSIAPLGESISVSKYVQIVIDVLKEENVRFKTNAMATVIETKDLETLLQVVQKAHNSVISSGGKRVITELKIDDRRDKNVTIESKLESLE